MSIEVEGCRLKVDGSANLITVPPDPQHLPST